MFNMPPGCHYASDLDQYDAMNPEDRDKERDDDEPVLPMHCKVCGSVLRWYIANNQYEARCDNCHTIFQVPLNTEEEHE